jgi:Fe-Mn family superoxide dismutase
MVQQQYTLPQLPYDFNELEPVISAEIMQIHYTKHHQAYVNNLNKALADFAAAESKQDISQMVSLQSLIKFNGGGHINHSIFWTNLISSKKGGGHLEKGALFDAICRTFGSLEKFTEYFSMKTAAIQGSGWGWLGFDKTKKSLCFATCENQDPLVTKGLVPLLGIDVWEHAYYLQYKSARADYLKAIWSIVNWKNVEERFLEASK